MFHIQGMQGRLDRAVGEKSSLEAELHDLLAQKLEAEDKLEEADQAARQAEIALRQKADDKLLALLSK